MWPVLHHNAKSGTYISSLFVIWIVSILSGGLTVEFFKYRLKYIIYKASTLFALPLLVIVVSYLSILYATIRRSYSSSRGNFERELKVSFTVFVLIALFLVSWAPFFTIAILSSTCKCITLTTVVYFKAVHFASTCVNPVVYAARMPDFKTAFIKIIPKQIVEFLCFFRDRTIVDMVTNSTRTRTSSTLSSTVQTGESGKRRATLLENRGAFEQLPVKINKKESPLAHSITSNKCVSLLSDSPTSTSGSHV